MMTAPQLIRREPLSTDRYVEMNRYAQRRMEDRHKPIDNRLALLGCEMRRDGAPRLGANIIGKMMEQGCLGASQLGAPTVIPTELVVTDWCVAQLDRTSIKRKVFEIAYVRLPHGSKEQKIAMLKRVFHVRMSPASWDTNMHGLREIVAVLYRVKWFELTGKHEDV